MAEAEEEDDALCDTICVRCEQPGGGRLVPLHAVDSGTGPAWTEYACLACTDQKTTAQKTTAQKTGGNHP
ncbi:hypothetical protein ABT173_27890 [Streptomyces sp. NPDC001795]|uniref:hypothetical protein n=1 Tax=Streptomyces sp. NPDC001795 TaxID=3154525 RepID=UPI0033342C89